MSSTRTTLRVLGLALLAALLHFGALVTLMSAGVGPFGRGVRLLASGTNTYNEATARTWFDTAEQFVLLDRFVLWPAVFLLASVFALRYIPGLKWRHSILIACAILPMSLPVERSQVPGSSLLSSWLALLAEVLAYALLVGFLSWVLRHLHAGWAARRAAA